MKETTQIESPEDSKEYEEFKREWLKTHDNLKGAHLKFQHQNRQVLEKIARAEEFERTDTTEYVAYSIISTDEGYVLRTFTIVQGRVVDKFDSKPAAKNFTLQRGQVALMKQALGRE